MSGTQVEAGSPGCIAGFAFDVETGARVGSETVGHLGSAMVGTSEVAVGFCYLVGCVHVADTVRHHGSADVGLMCAAETVRHLGSAAVGLMCAAEIVRHFGSAAVGSRCNGDTGGHLGSVAVASGGQAVGVDVCTVAAGGEGVSPVAEAAQAGPGTLRLPEAAKVLLPVQRSAALSERSVSRVGSDSRHLGSGAVGTAHVMFCSAAPVVDADDDDDAELAFEDVEDCDAVGYVGVGVAAVVELHRVSPVWEDAV